MRFHLFTRRTTYASLRLRFLSRGMQVFGVLLLVVSVAAAQMIATMPLSDQIVFKPGIRSQVIRSILVSGLFTALSYFLVGRALRRRERWSGYAAAIAIGLPALLRATDLMRVSRGDTYVDIAAVVTLTLIATVWRELGSVPASALLDHGGPPKPSVPLTPRNRGYGERPSLPIGNHHEAPLKTEPGLAAASLTYSDIIAPEANISLNNAPTPTV